MFLFSGIKFLLLIIFLIPFFCHSQEVDQPVGNIEVTYVEYCYELDSLGKLTLIKNVDVSNPFRRLFFDNEGKLLKEMYYYDTVYDTYSLISKIYDYHYSDHRVDIISYNGSECSKIYCLNEHTVRIYDSLGRVVEEKSKYIGDDPESYISSNPHYLDRSNILFKYYNSNNTIKKMFSDTNYEISFLDNLNRIKLLECYVEGKLLYEYNYQYLDSLTQVEYKSYSIKYPRQNIFKYYLNSKGVVNTIVHDYKNEEYYSLNQKNILFYDENGLLNRIDKYRFGDAGNYILDSRTVISVKSALPLTDKQSQVLKNIL